MTVDSFRFLPRILARYYQTIDIEVELPIPWTPVSMPLTDCVFGLVTSGGLYVRGKQCPFDVHRERLEPTWGDPSFRRLEKDINPAEVGISHLHLNTRPIQEDFNVLLPMQRFLTIQEREGIGGLSAYGYSFMGYQGFPPDTSAWKEIYAPQVVQEFKAEGVQCVLLTPA
jgi:D-proline reductase (dithiol) PrdB